MSLPHCTILDLSCNPLNVVPVCVQELQALENLHLDDCSKLKSWNEIRKPWKYLRQCHIRRTQLPLFTGLLIEWNVLEYLSISENSSINDFPSDVVILENLKTFEAQKCGFSFIPTSIGNLSSLTHLDLRQNQYSDASFSEAFGKLKHLVYLNLSENRLSTIPECFLLFSELKELDLSHNRITIIPDNLWRLHKLEKLNLSFNCLTSLPDNIGEMEMLSHFEVKKNCITIIPQSIGHLYFLQRLDIDKNAITELPIELGNLKNLVSFEYADNPLLFPPLEVIKGGKEAIFRYFESQSENLKSP
ncbi:hypothetical protein HMI55_003843 [Coelomomyces lativittatus]|nr:hypothetical protein HMI55_003843 [Coelomomyces lativittatus]